LAVIGFLAVFMAVRFETLAFRAASPLESRPHARYTRVWIDRAGTIVGAEERGNILTVERWSGSSWKVDLEGISAPRSWSVSPDLTRVVWISERALHARTEKGPDTNVPIAGEPPVAAGAFSDGTVGVVLRDANVVQFDAATGRTVGSFHTGLSTVDQALFDNDYLAIASRRTRTILLYRYEDGQWKLAQRADTPDGPFQLLLPAPGVMAVVDSGSLRMGDEIRNTPGAVQSVAALLLDFIATGEFEGVYVAPPKREEYRIAPAQPGSVVAVSPTRLAVSGPGGTAFYSMSVEKRLSARGRTISAVAFACLGSSLLLGFGGLLIELLSRLFHGQRKVYKTTATALLHEPPAGLIQAIAQESCVLWAGSGLSAQAGYPTRTTFASLLARTAELEEWVAVPLARKLRKMCEDGKHEQALAELVRRNPEDRPRFVEFCRSTYGRFAIPSRTHEAITRLAFPSAITTNYDPLLEQMRDAWMGRAVTLQAEAVPRNYVLKLFGDLSVPATLLLSRDELSDALVSSPMRFLVASALRTRTLLFIGCSPDGLLADLDAFQIEPTAIAEPGRTHYAIAGVSGTGWMDAAEDLRRRYGIELFPCDEEHIGAELTRFMETLTQEVARLRGTPDPVPQPASN
jgi:hypothetical protein